MYTIRNTGVYGKVGIFYCMECCCGTWSLSVDTHCDFKLGFSYSAGMPEPKRYNVMVVCHYMRVVKANSIKCASTISYSLTIKVSKNNWEIF